MNQYIVQDISTADKWAITIDNGMFGIALSDETASDNPIVEDDANAGTFWEIVVDDGQIMVRTTATEQDDEIELFDATLSKTFRLAVYDGQLNFYEVETILEGSVFSIRTSINDWIQQRLRIA